MSDADNGMVHIDYHGRKGRADQSQPIDVFPPGQEYDPLDDVFDPENLTPEQEMEEILARARSAVLARIKGR